MNKGEEEKKTMMKKLIPNKQIILNHYVTGYPKESDFGLRSSTTSCTLSHGSSSAVLLKNLYLSCDPYMRHRMSDHISHSGTIVQSTSGSVLVGYGVSKVIESTHPSFKEGDFVWGMIGWEEYTLITTPDSLNKINITDVPLSYYAGILGMPGIAAYAGFHKICYPKEGDCVYVSSASGGVGQLVGQFAKLMGCYVVVGSASTEEKVDLLKHKMGFDEAFNYKEEHDLGSALRRYFPQGIDIYFDNVGGHMLDEVILHMKVHGRIALCGMISQYNIEKPEGVRNMFSLIMKRIEMKGFVEKDFGHVYPELVELCIKYLQEGKLVYVEDIAQGLENAPSALVGIFYGCNVGKQVVCIAKE
ncbi:unnamed protein product [Prunus brigantina]